MIYCDPHACLLDGEACKQQYVKKAVVSAETSKRLLEIDNIKFLFNRF